MTDQPWAWPAGRVMVLYHWSWFDSAIGVVVGWSRRGEVDEHGFVHLEAEDFQPARALEIGIAVDPIVISHTLSALTRLPGELRSTGGTPLRWVRALISAEEPACPAPAARHAAAPCR